jgi:hypothetical protein
MPNTKEFKTHENLPHASSDGLMSVRLDPLGVLLEAAPYTNCLFDNGSIGHDLHTNASQNGVVVRRYYTC